MHVGENFFQLNYQYILKLSHNLHFLITRSGAHLMQNQQITPGYTAGNYGNFNQIEMLLMAPPEICNLFKQ